MNVWSYRTITFACIRMLIKVFKVFIKMTHAKEQGGHFKAP